MLLFTLKKIPRGLNAYTNDNNVTLINLYHLSLNLILNITLIYLWGSFHNFAFHLRMEILK